MRAVRMNVLPIGVAQVAGYAYFGVNSDKAEHFEKVKWSDYLTDPSVARVEDIKVPLQVYPYVDG